MAQGSIGIVGSGPIGQGLATLWAHAGYAVTLGIRSPESAARVTVPAPVTVATFEDAAAHDIVVLAVRHAGADDVIERLRTHLDGKLVLDTMNSVTVADGRIVSGLTDGRSEGARMQLLLPGSVVVRAFTHVQDELLVSRARRQPGVWAVAYATDGDVGRERVERLIVDAGYAPVFAGSLADSALLDPGGALFAHLLVRADAEGLVTAHRLSRMLARFNDATLADVLHAEVRWRFPYGPTIGVPEIFRGRQEVAAHLGRVQASGVRIADIRTELETPWGAVVHATGSFPSPGGGIVSSPIVSVVGVRDGLIADVREYWDTAAIR